MHPIILGCIQGAKGDVKIEKRRNVSNYKNIRNTHARYILKYIDTFLLMLLKMAEKEGFEPSHAV